MRLIHTTTLEMKEFFPGRSIPNSKIQQLESSAGRESQIPEYAILSHVWGPEEITFQDFMGSEPGLTKKAGYAKILGSCKQARKDKLDYIWIDTCCIDKTSSTELSEAINSMFQWYRDSKICYAYLADIGPPHREPYFQYFTPGRDQLVINHVRQKILSPEFGNTKLFSSLKHYRGSSEDGVWYHAFPSRWFTRGWTLQELIAPSDVEFFDEDWTSIGTRDYHIRIISEITDIDMYALNPVNRGDLGKLSIARRMSWVATRETTRAEDMAYCLLGIFNINMPLLYGEGENAFLRLQEEILKVSDDQSLFAWKDPELPPYRQDYTSNFKEQGLLAATPDLFRYSDDVSQLWTETSGLHITTSTTKGLQVRLLIFQDPTYSSGLIYLAVLNCPVGNIPGILPGIRLRRLSTNTEQYTRIDASQLLLFGCPDLEGHIELGGFDPTNPQGRLMDIRSRSVLLDWKPQTIFVRQEHRNAVLPGLWLLSYEQIDVKGAYPPDLWDPKTRIMQSRVNMGHGTKKSGALHVKALGQDTILIFGTTYWESSPWCEIHNYAAQYKYPPYCQGPIIDVDPAYLKRWFDDFQVGSVRLPTNMESRAHEFVSEKLPFRTRVEVKNVSGRDMYLLHLDYWFGGKGSHEMR